MIATLERPTPVVEPTPDEVAAARDASGRLAALAGDVRLADAGGRESILLTPAVRGLLADALRQLAAGRGVSVVPSDKELTTQEAADLLNVSRPYLVRLLDGGAIPVRMVGTHRRVRLADVLAYKARDDAAREAAMADLAAASQELDMGY